MMIQHPQDLRRTLHSDLEDKNCYALALHLSRLHPNGLEPTLLIRDSAASGRQITNLYWSEVGIRVFFSEHFEAAVATSFSFLNRGLVSQRFIIYKFGQPIPQGDIDMLFNPSKQEDRF